MNLIVATLGTAAMLGSALVGGVFYAFSSFIMKALARVPSAEGIGAMQSINVAVINRSFLGVFFGTALLSVVMIVISLVNRDDPSTIEFISGATLYIVGVLLVTVFCNIPLNDRLAAMPAEDSDAKQLWMHYVDRWTQWNTIRTVAAILGSLFFAIGLMQAASA